MASRTAARTRIGAQGRRLTALSAGALLVATSLTACGSSGGDKSGTASSPTEITVAHGYTGPEQTALTKQVAEWNAANPTIKVKLQFNGGNDNALQKTVAGFTAGNYPDAAYEYGSSAAQLAKQPKLVDLTDKVTAAGFNWNDFYPSRAAGLHRQRESRRHPGPR